MHEVLVNRLGGLSLPRKSVVRLTDRPDMTLDVYRGRKTTLQQQQLQAFRTPKFYIAPYGKINHGLVRPNCNCDVKSGEARFNVTVISQTKVRGLLNVRHKVKFWCSEC